MRTGTLLLTLLLASALALAGCDGKEQGEQQTSIARTAPAAPQPQSRASQPAVSPPASAAASGPAVEPKPESETSPDTIVYVTRTGQKYHVAGCRYLARSSIPMKLSEAKNRYGPCSKCNPPQ